MTVSIRLGPNFFSCSGLGQSADGLGWVTQNGPTDNSYWAIFRYILLQAKQDRETVTSRLCQPHTQDGVTVARDGDLACSQQLMFTLRVFGVVFY